MGPSTLLYFASPSLVYKLDEEQWSIEDNALPVLNKLVAPLSSIVMVYTCTMHVLFGLYWL